MKSILLLFILFVSSQSLFAQQPDPSKPLLIAEASCGQCNFNMKGDGCALAVRIKGKSYFVDGTSIDEHGDAHAKDGFCNAIRKAEVQGTIENGRFKATYFKLLPAAKKQPSKKGS